MKQRGVSEDTVEVAVGKIELEEILLPYFATAVRARHRGEALSAVQADCAVTALGQDLEVTPRPATKIEERERRIAFNILQHCRNILADIMAARAFPEILGNAVVLVQR